MAFHSAEIRWFARDETSRLLLEKFYASIGGRGLQETERTDLYLETGLDTTGIKLREGRLEIKERIGTGRILEVNDRSIGQMESWVKWSVEAGAAAEARTDGADKWVPLKKQRKKKVFGIKGYRIHAAGPDEILEDGCLVELTYLAIPGCPETVTMGYEAFGRQSACERNLIYAIEQTVTEGIALPGPAMAFSYPGFLLQLRAGPIC